MAPSAVRQSLCIAWLALAGAGCGRGPTGAMKPPAPRCDVAAPAGEASGLYLPPETAAGALWCFDPDSTALRASLMAPPADPSDVLDAGELAADVDFLHEINAAEGRRLPGAGSAPELRRLESVGVPVDAHLSDPGAPVEDILPLLDALP